MARSRYSRNDIIDGRYYGSFVLEQTNQFKEPDTFENIRYRDHIVKYGERLDHLAARFFNDDKYWWVIALINNLTMPTITPGQKIKIPLSVQDVLDRVL